jgi:hypothetical protein
MKKNAKILTAICIVVLATTSIFSVKPQSVKQNLHQTPTMSTKVCINYTWYRDEEMSDPVGTYSDINVEAYRLSVLFSGYTFSSSYGMGLLPFEYGYHPSLPTVIIYSNLY